MWRLPAPFVGEYAEKDAEITLKLWHALQHEISKQDFGMYLTWRQTCFRVWSI